MNRARTSAPSFLPEHVRIRIGRVAIVGGGVAGLACARTLVDHDVDVVVFDKGRAPGGRLASRRTAELAVDLGAQYFTVKDERFGRLVASWREDGVVAPWTARIRAVDNRGGAMRETEPVERFVGTPSMSAIAHHLARGLEVRASHRVDLVERRGGEFLLRGTAAPVGTTLGVRDASLQEEPLRDLGAFDVIVLCLPPAQASSLLEGVSKALSERVREVRFDACVAFGFVADDDACRSAPFDGLFVGRDGDPDRVIAWVARDSSKPMRGGGDAWVVHAASEWSSAHLRDLPEQIERALLGDLARVLGVGSLRAKTSAMQRWAFARAPAPLDSPLFDDEARIGVGGDWTAGGRVEGAFLSGVALAERVLGLPEPA